MASASLASSLLLLISIYTVASATQAPASAPDHHDHHHSPTQPPTPPPYHTPGHPYPPPTHTPTTPPAHPPTTQPPHAPTTQPPARKYVAIQGVVYCKSCKYRGIDTLQGAAPLNGSVVKLQCNNTKNGLVEQTKTDKNGYFFFMPQKLTTSGSHKCKVFLVSSPLSTCNVATNLHGGASGAVLTQPQNPRPGTKPLPFLLFTVGPFAYEPYKDCHA